ncbi:MAG TPA: Gfo/Idh/MocA family oxidoreductase [Terriglobia bacterium]|nr:Gfo/Idh/MocA family oxidoreductase [Terriglobia bacterium]
MNKEKIHVGVVGAGEHGRNHARQYRSIEGAELVGIYDLREDRRREAAEEFGVTAFGSLDQLWQAVQAASIVIPTTDHAVVARQALTSGVDILLEKPITRTLEEADEIVQLAAARRRVLQVGHVERFNPGVVAARSVTLNPLFFEIHRLGVFSPRSLDVDVVFDLMIHDLDLVLWMTQSSVRDVRAVGLPVLSDKVDIANARVEFESGAVANLTASRVSTEKVRKFRYFQPHEYLSIDFTRRDVLVVNVEQGMDSPQIGFRNLPTQPAEPLHAELEAFLESVRSRRPPLVDGVEGRKALALATQVMNRIQEHAEHVNLRLIQPPGRSGES